jgi:Na+-transporting NADH:ubiquinone oxidoreductase subunit NqrD
VDRGKRNYLNNPLGGTQRFVDLFIVIVIREYLLSGDLIGASVSHLTESIKKNTNRCIAGLFMAVAKSDFVILSILSAGTNCAFA